MNVCEPGSLLEVLDDGVVVVGQVLHPSLVDDPGQDLDDPVVEDVAHQGVAAVPEGGAHGQVSKGLAFG